MDDETKKLIFERRELAVQMMAVDPASEEMRSLLDQEAAIVEQIKATGLDLNDLTVAYGIAYGVLADA